MDGIGKGDRLKGLRRWEVWLVAGVVAACVALGVWLYLPRAAQGGAVALISVDGQERYLVALAEDGPSWSFSIQQETGKPVCFEVGPQGIRFSQVDCPDHLCEQMGWCLSPGNRAVCLPNRTFLAVYDRQELPNTEEARWITPQQPPV